MEPLAPVITKWDAGGGGDPTIAATMRPYSHPKHRGSHREVTGESGPSANAVSYGGNHEMC